MKKPLLLSVVTCVVLLSACAALKPADKKSSLASKGGAASAGAAEAAPAAPAADVTEAGLKTGGDFSPRETLRTVQFDYDSAKLSDEAVAVLKANAEAIKADATLQVEIAGHCDARGTVAYNLALGQKRAKEVRDYYIKLGVDGSRMATISFGKEKPVCAESNDDCWGRNRRAETLARAKK